MDQCLPVNRMSLASLEEEQFFSAYSTRPTSRVISVSQEQGRPPESVASLSRTLEPLTSHLPLLAETVPPSTNDQATLCKHSTETYAHLPRHRHSSPTSSCYRLNQSKAQGPPDFIEVASSKEGMSTTSSNDVPDRLASSPAPAITTRRCSSATGREQSLVACHYQGRLPPMTRAQLDGFVSKKGMDDILCNVRAYLSAGQHTRSSRKPSMMVTNENDTPSALLQTLLDGPSIEMPALPEDQYLVTADNIAKILDIVIAGVRSSIQANDTQPGCQSLLFPNGTHAKPTLRSQNIIPGVSSVAGPATTICSPRPCFSLADDLEEPGRLHLKPKTTYSSSYQDDACYDCADADAAGVDCPESSRSVSLVYSSQGRHGSWPPSRGVAQKVSLWATPRDSFNPFETQFQQAEQRSLSEPIPQRQPKNRVIYTSTPAPITSFPKLISRACTNDWLTPLGLFDDMDNGELSESETMIPNFYSHGVDAHSGVGIHNPLPILEEASQTTSTTPNRSPFHSPIQEFGGQWSSHTGELDEDHGEKLGCPAGTTSHRRIKTREPHGRHKNMNENYLDGLHHYSFMPHSDGAPISVHGNRPIQPPWSHAPPVEDNGRKRSSRELLQRILHESDASSRNSSRSKSG
ncbi:hypothetical protein F4825DRAFT_469680 [Nemania diffusa]|nr:hypothetical protein F4825DRAFT_469680 [Nemania diffusa]